MTEFHNWVYTQTKCCMAGQQSTKWHIHFNIWNQNILIGAVLAIANPQLQIFSCHLVQLHTKPRWPVQLAASAAGATPLPVPQRVVGIKIRWVTRTWVSRITEIVFPNERRNLIGPVVVGIGTGTVRSCISGILFIQSSYKCPDVLPGSHWAMS